MTRLVLTVIAAYQRLISPLFAPRCRFVPSCSQFATDAIRQYGLRRGGWLGLRRLARCHPFHRGGYDPVPDRADAVARPAAGVKAPC